MLEEWDRVVRTMGRIPTIDEFNRRSPMSYDSLRRRFGYRDQVLARYRQWRIERELKRRAEAANADDGANRQADADDGTNDDVRWMRRRWQQLRVGFELRSSFFRGRRPDACDLLVVLEHDWKGCPVPVYVFGEVVSESS